MCGLCSVGEGRFTLCSWVAREEHGKGVSRFFDKVHINKRCSDRTEFFFKAYKTSPPEPCSEVVIVPHSEGPSLFKGWSFDLLLITV